MNDSAQEAIDKAAIQEAICTMMLMADLKRRDEMAAFYASRIRFDYSAVFPGSSSDASLEEYREMVKREVPYFEVTQHMMSNFVIELEGDAASSVCQLRGTHRIGQARWVLGGRYRHRLVREQGKWLVSHIQVEVLYEKGREVLELARRLSAANANKS